MHARPWLLVAALALLATPALAGDAGKTAGDDVSTFFTQADADKDGKLTLDEFKTFRGLVAQRRAEGQFQRLDAEHTGTVTLAQVRAFAIARGGPRHRKDAGTGTKQ